jgi:hypothetical protein
MPSKATKSVRRRGREVGQGQGELWEKANSNAVVGAYLGGVQSYMHVKWQYPIFSGPRNRILSVLCIDSASGKIFHARGTRSSER